MVRQKDYKGCSSSPPQGPSPSPYKHKVCTSYQLEYLNFHVNLTRKKNKSFRTIRTLCADIFTKIWLIDCFDEISENLNYPIGANLSLRDTVFSRKHNLLRIPKPSKLDEMSFSIYFDHGVNRVSLKKTIFFQILSDWRTPKKTFFLKNKKCPIIIDCLFKT